MAKILVVDDETDLEVLIKQKFRRQIREQKYEFTFASDGNDAHKKLRQIHGFGGSDIPALRCRNLRK